MAATISQRISLEGSEELQRQLVALGKAGEQAFQQIQAAASKPIADPAQMERTKQVVDQLVVSAQQLAQQFKPLNDNVVQFGAAGTRATQQVTTGLNQTNAAAQKTSATIQQAGQSAATAGQGAGSTLLSAATKFGLAATAIGTAIAAIQGALTKGAVETSKAVSDQANSLGLSIPKMQALRTAFQGTSLAGKEAGEVINKDVGDKLKNITGDMGKATGQVQLLGGSLRQIAVETKGGMVTISSFGSRAKDRLAALKNEGIFAATNMRKFGVSAEAIASGDSLRALREMARHIDGISNEAVKAATGTNAFGGSWREVTDALLQSVVPIDKSTASLAELGKMNRQLSETDVTLGKGLDAQLKDLNNALKAAKDQIGALFFAPATGKAKWLTDLIDGTAELIRQWARLDQFKQTGFLAGLGEGPAQTAFKILVALGQQLAAIWTNILIPAGQRVVGIISEISGRLSGTSTAQVAAGFITLTAAVIGLSLAFRAVGLVFAPFAALLSLFSGFGPILLALAGIVVLFWDEFKSAALSALALIPNALIGFRQAMEALLQGDFQSFWGLFAASAQVAFATITQAILQADGVLNDFARALVGMPVRIPWVQEVVNAFKQIGAELPGAILLIASAFLVLRRASVLAATAIKRVFGIELTGTSLAAILIIGQLTGALQAFASIAIIAGVAFNVLFGLIGLAMAAFGGLPVLIFLVIAGLATLAGVLIALNWDKIKTQAVLAFGLIPGLIALAIAAVKLLVLALRDPAAAWELIKAGAAAAWDFVISKVQAAKTAILGFAASLPAIAWGLITSGAGAAWDFIKQKALEAKAAVQEFAGSLSSIVWEAIKAGAAEAWDWVKRKVLEAKAVVLEFVTSLPGNIWETFKNAAIVAWDAIIAKIWEAVAALAQFMGGGGGAGGKPGVVGGGKNASGGLIGGRGTGTSDSNLAWVSRGEHIMPARAVRQPGVLAFLEALRRSGGDLSRVLDRMGHFALGGLVPGPIAIPAFASGGLAGSSNVTIQFPGLPPISGLRASSAVVDELRQAAVMAQVRSGGRKPSRYS